MTSRFDPRLYAILDLAGVEPSVPLEAVEAALLGGVTLLQIRAKKARARSLLAAARQIRTLAIRHGVPVLLNDRADLAMAAGADGVHLGRSDIPAGSIRRIWPEAVIGISVRSPAELAEAEDLGVDYAASGCLYPTVSKPDAIRIDLEAFAAIARAAGVPVVGIGGITVARVPEVLAGGAAGVAVIHGLWSAPDVRERARQYRAALEPPGLNR